MVFIFMPTLNAQPLECRPTWVRKPKPTASRLSRGSSRCRKKACVTDPSAADSAKGTSGKISRPPHPAKRCAISSPAPGTEPNRSTFHGRSHFSERRQCLTLAVPPLIAWPLVATHRTDPLRDSRHVLDPNQDGEPQRRAAALAAAPRRSVSRLRTRIASVIITPNKLHPKCADAMTMRRPFPDRPLDDSGARARYFLSRPQDKASLRQRVAFHQHLADHRMMGRQERGIAVPVRLREITSPAAERGQPRDDFFFFFRRPPGHRVRRPPIYTFQGARVKVEHAPAHRQRLPAGSDHRSHS